MTDTSSTAPAKPERTSLLEILAAWCGLAAVAQVCFLAFWPLYVLDIRVDYWPAVAVSLARLGLYLGLAWGLARRRPEAWAVTVLELFRTFALAVWPMLAALLQREPQSLSFYPASWAQGLLTGGLPLAVAFDTAVKCGWRPNSLSLWGGHAVPVMSILLMLVRILVAISFAVGSSLWREREQFGVVDGERWAVLLRRGLPLFLALCVVEGGAASLSRRPSGARGEGARPVPAARRVSTPAWPAPPRGGV